MLAEAPRLLIAGHLHLDGVLRGLPGVGDPHHELLRDAPLTAFERLIETALEQGVDALLLTGSLFDRLPTIRTAALFRDGIEALQEEGITTIYAGPTPEQIRQLTKLNCCPEEMTLLAPGHRTEISIASLHLALFDEQHRNSLTKSKLDIGITWDAFGHFSEDHRLLHGNRITAPLIISSAHESAVTQQLHNSIAHAAGSVQAVNGTVPGVRSVTLCQMNANGEVDLQAIPLSVVAYKELNFQLSDNDSMDDIELKMAEIIEQDVEKSLPACVQLCHLNWKVKGSSKAVAKWPSQSLLELLDLNFSELNSAIELINHVQLIPQLSGSPHLHEEAFDEEWIEEELLRFLSEECQSDAGCSLQDRELSEQNRSKLKLLPFQELQQELETNTLCHRAAELGLQALRDQQKAG
ncbi:MAG TPA: hypothetical protein DD473_02445 [Planctomycetaceae bacterium]|nr:hypothetical protein [Planctomycetaceae bacterium]